MRSGTGSGYGTLRWQIIGLLSLALGNVVVFATVTRPAWRAFTAGSSAVLVGQRAQATLEPQLERARRQYGPVLGAETQLRELRAHVGSQSGTVADVVSTLRAAVDAAGLRADRITYSADEVVELGLTQLQIGLPVRGDYRQLRRLLDQLLDGPMFIVLERISAAAPPANELAGDLTLNLAASVFLATAPGAAVPPVRNQALPTPSLGNGADPATIAGQLAGRLSELPAIPLPEGSFDLPLGRLAPGRGVEQSVVRDLFSIAARRAVPVVDVPAIDAETANLPPDPILPYVLIGVNRTETGLLATLVDGDLVLVVRQGQMLPDGYLISAIDAMSVTLEAGGLSETLLLRSNSDDDR